jgi:hypothetical protein
MNKVCTPLLDTLSRRAKRFVDVRRSGHREKLRAYRDSYKGCRAFVIGNGPSVRIEDLELLQNEVTFCCNRFHLAYPLIEFRPSHTVIADSLMLENFGSEIAANCDSDLMVGSAYLPQNLKGNFSWIRLRNRAPFQFNFDITGPVAPGGSVIVVALQAAFYMGIREIYLYGVDHDFSFLRKTVESDVVSGEGNHFIPNYRSGKSWHPPDVVEIEKALATCRRFYEAQSGRILNTTRAENLTVFERASFDQITSGASTNSEGTSTSTTPTRRHPR